MSDTQERPLCGVCGQPMPPGEEMFVYHGYSGSCPKPPLPKAEAQERSDPRCEAIHKTRDVWCKVSVDAEIADMVEYLNSLPGVYTYASCQGRTTYGPHVMAYWPEELDTRISAEFIVGEKGVGWAYLYPKETTKTTTSKKERRHE